MSDIPVAVSVMNGEVQAGDKVAYPTRAGSWMDMKIAKVLSVGFRDHSWKFDGGQPLQVPFLKVEVIQISGCHKTDPYRTQIGELDRVVKL